MDASPILRDALGALNRARLEAVMIGNAAAALHGAPVTTIDVDFMIRDTPGNMRKLKAVARSFEGLKTRASLIRIDGEQGLLACLEDIIRSTKSAARPRDVAVLPILQQTLHEKKSR